jgi:hypothetical protein
MNPSPLRSICEARPRAVQGRTVLQQVALCCNRLPCVATVPCDATGCTVLQQVALCCNRLPCDATGCPVLQQCTVMRHVARQLFELHPKEPNDVERLRTL